MCLSRQSWVEHHCKQLDGVSELHVSDPHTLWLVDLRQLLACTKNHSFSLGRVQKQRILSEPAWHVASAAFYVRQSSEVSWVEWVWVWVCEWIASVKSRLVLPFWYRLTRVVPDKGPLNMCVCSRAHVCVYDALSLTCTVLFTCRLIVEQWSVWVCEWTYF